MPRTPTAADLEHLAELLREAAQNEILPRFRSTAGTAKADGSLVTDADLGVQRRLTAALAARWPEVALLGEEMDAAEQARLLAAGGPLWCLDPLDGTTNFACGFPGFCISLALLRDGRTELAVILDPLRDECFTAARGQGAWLDGAPLVPYAPGPALGDCVAVIDFKRIPPARVPTLFGAGGFRSQRNLGAVALEWCWLAAGRFQLYLHGGQKLWDYAAGRLVAAEAGCASGLFAPGGDAPVTGLDLGKRLALAAADEALFARWRAFVKLPLLEP
ncbi:inositol monophosphatase family protein [Thiohalocapsa sp. ML1]|uniref:inositol monophosphatase family protein n=1 Tax=Thiohalocapsa sp. ML1 TaxID=1431688 RepID=UPI000731EF5B|nr:inositol monophosphatase family protein [Thiohalocapsa sp. ML1]